ncbi:MAG: hypothetical protein K6G86_04725 [Bacteroidales bacterium]|nr:hypothetical protein [Bacteroidales bacterium]
MKKLSTSLCVLLASLSLFAQSAPKNEIFVSYGLGSAADINVFFHGFAAAMMGINDTDYKVSGTGSVAAGYYRQVSPLVSVGGIFAYNGVTTTEEGVTTRKNYYSLLPSVKFNWYQREWFGAYSKFSAGARLIHTPEATNVKFATQVSLLGLEVGKRFRIFGEAGFGDQGAMLLGLRYRF